MNSISIAEYRQIARVQPKKASRSRPEEMLQRDCFSLIVRLRGANPILNHLFHVPNGGGRSAAEAGILKATGVMPGVPDFILPFPCLAVSGLAIELKAGSNTLTDEQRSWLGNASQNKWIVGVARSLDEFRVLVDAFLMGEYIGPEQGILPGSREILADRKLTQIKRSAQCN